MCYASGQLTCQLFRLDLGPISGPVRHAVVWLYILSLWTSLGEYLVTVVLLALLSVTTPVHYPWCLSYELMLVLHRGTLQMCSALNITPTFYGPNIWIWVGTFPCNYQYSLSTNCHCTEIADPDFLFQIGLTHSVSTKSFIFWSALVVLPFSLSFPTIKFVLCSLGPVSGWLLGQNPACYEM